MAPRPCAGAGAPSSRSTRAVCPSRGKNSTTASSESATSAGAPNVATVLNIESSPCGVRKRSGTMASNGFSFSCGSSPKGAAGSRSGGPAGPGPYSYPRISSSYSAPVPTAASDNAPLLRKVLRIDGAATAVMGVLLVAGSSVVGELTGMPVAFGSGIFQLGGAAALALIAGHPSIPRGLGRAVVCVNAASCAGCAVLAFSGLLPLTGFGVAFMLVGAVVVAVFADLEHLGLRRMTPARH